MSDATGVHVDTYNVGPGSSSSAGSFGVVNNKPVGASTSTLIDSAGHINVDNTHFGADGQGSVAGEYVAVDAVGVSAGASVTTNGIGTNTNDAAADTIAAAATIAAADTIAAAATIAAANAADTDAIDDDTAIPITTVIPITTAIPINTATPTTTAAVVAPGTGAIDVFHIGPVHTSGSYTTNQGNTDADDNDTQGSGNSVITGIQQITSAVVNGGIPIREGIATILNLLEGTLHLFGTQASFN